VKLRDCSNNNNRNRNSNSSRISYSIANEKEQTTVRKKEGANTNG
jgi:hypothetical protein